MSNDALTMSLQSLARRDGSRRGLQATLGLLSVIPSSGLGHTSYARCDQLRVVSVERLSSRRRMISPEQMHPPYSIRAFSSSGMP